MNNFLSYSMSIIDIILILSFLTNNRCVLAEFSIAESNSYFKITNRSELLINSMVYNNIHISIYL